MLYEVYFWDDYQWVYVGETLAVSEKQACNNYRFRNWNGKFIGDLRNDGTLYAKLKEEI